MKWKYFELLIILHKYSYIRLCNHITDNYIRTILCLLLQLSYINSTLILKWKVHINSIEQFSLNCCHCMFKLVCCKAILVIVVPYNQQVLYSVYMCLEITLINTSNCLAFFTLTWLVATIVFCFLQTPSLLSSE